MATFEAVQAEIAKRAEKYGGTNNCKEYPFSGIMTCANCGKHYRRKTTATGPVWICSTYNTYGKKACASKAIPEVVLTSIAEKHADKKITAITVERDNQLVLKFADGGECKEIWQDRSRSESWDKEKRAAARRKTNERNVSNG